MAVKRTFDIHSSDPEASSPGGRGSSLPPSSPPELPLFGDHARFDVPEAELAEFEELNLEDREVDDDDDEEEEQGEDLFGDAMDADYRSRKDLDQYNMASDEIDDEEYEAMDIGERRRVDALLDRRDEIIHDPSGSGRSRKGAFASSLDADDDDNYGRGGAGALPTENRRRNKYDEAGDADDAVDDDDELREQPLSLEALADVKAGSVAEWVAQPGVHQAIAREYKRFLKEFTDEKGISVYGHRGQVVASENLESFQLDYPDLVAERAVLAYFLAVAPEEVLKILDVATMDAITMMFSDYKAIQPEIHVRVAGLPTSFTLRELREHHLNTLVRVTGVVTRRTGVFPQLKYVKFDCVKCGEVLGPYVQDSQSEVRISFCHNCQSRGPFQVNSEKTLYRNYQRITLQESPGTVPAGRLPRQRDAILLWDLIDRVKPGDEVDLTGIYKNAYDGVLNVKNGFPVFATVIEANNIIRRNAGHAGDIQCTAQEAEDMQRRARDPKIIDKIIDSIAPSIYGHRDIKRAVACSLFGGVAKETGKIRLRGDINVLLLGDPGTAKSQILKYAEQTASRAVFATGQGASAVGLTASVRKDPVTREWTLEGGALVLADKGTCLIDEFDKMNDQDRTSIHEAMEQQSISISKAGIVTSLQARCAIIAAANPRDGRYNASQTLAANVDLTEPILSRFDVLCVVQDIPNPENDEQLARFVVSSHAKSAGRLDETSDRMAADGEIAEGEQDDEDDLAMSSTGEAPFSQDYLRKYIYYARNRVRPQLMEVDQNRIAALYSQLREESLKTGAFPITVRHLESIIRLSESFARMRLADFVSSSDVDRAIRVSVESFVQAQKMIHRRALRQSFTRFTYHTPA